MLIIMNLTAVPAAKAASPLDAVLNFMGRRQNTNTNNNSNNNDGSKNSDNQGSVGNVPQNMSDPKDVEKAAEFASQATGVDKDFLMGMLVVESNLGKNTGQCTYQEVSDGAQAAYDRGRLSQSSWNIFQKRSRIIKSLADSLGYDYKNVKVSCNPSYAGTGGALGISQFMPDIWMDYKDAVGKIVGKANPDPWNTEDGVIAMALLLKDTPGVTEHNLTAERNAAKMYLSGTVSPLYDWYANEAFYWAQNYQKLLG